jgi:hypothetical protein
MENTIIDSIKTNIISNYSYPNTSKILTPFWNTAKTVGCIALGVFFDFGDGFIRGAAVQLGFLGIVFAYAPGGIPLLITSIFAYYISKKLISEKVATACYRWGELNPNSDLRYVPFALGIGTSYAWVSSLFAVPLGAAAFS